MFESLVVRDLRVLAQPLDASLRYFHTDHHEIDIVIQHARVFSVDMVRGGTVVRSGRAWRRWVWA